MDILPIRKIIENIGSMSGEMPVLKKALSKFKCSQDLDVQNFLNYHAVDYDINHRTRTYLCFDDGVLVAYYSVAVKNLIISESVSKSYHKKLTYGHTKTNYVPAYLIAQIGKDDDYKRKNVIKKY